MPVITAPGRLRITIRSKSVWATEGDCLNKTN